jgi:hypothetical protein
VPPSPPANERVAGGASRLLSVAGVVAEAAAAHTAHTTTPPTDTSPEQSFRIGAEADTQAGSAPATAGATAGAAATPVSAGVARGAGVGAGSDAAGKGAAAGWRISRWTSARISASHAWSCAERGRASMALPGLTPLLAQGLCAVMRLTPSQLHGGHPVMHHHPIGSVSGASHAATATPRTAGRSEANCDGDPAPGSQFRRQRIEFSLCRIQVSMQWRTTHETSESIPQAGSRRPVTQRLLVTGSRRGADDGSLAR